MRGGCGGPLEALLALPGAQHPLRLASVHCTEDPAFLRICWVVGTCGSGFRSWQPCCPSSVCIIIAKTSPFSRLVRGGASLCPVALGRGCCFSESYLCSSVAPSRLPVCCSAPPTLPGLPTLSLESPHLQYLCSLWDGPSASPHALFVRVLGCFLSFLSLRKLWLRFYLRFEKAV